MDVAEIAIPAVSAAGGVVSAGWMAKLLITSWLEKYDKGMDIVRENDKALAVLQSQIKTIQKDIDGLGSSVREQMKKLGGTP